jgi:1-acyl-sn-glycerol-3-phosphate acyltransferase
MADLGAPPADPQTGPPRPAEHAPVQGTLARDVPGERADRDVTFSIEDEGHGYDVFGANATWVARAERLLSPLYDSWFRVRSSGAHHIPTRGPAILVANHGGTLPFDATMLWADVLRHTRPRRVLRPIADHFVQGLPFVGEFGARTGSIGGTLANVRRALSHGELLLIFPEGVPGIAKKPGHRYELLEFRVGHAELAIRHRAPIIPAAVVGAEEQMPVMGRLPVHWFGIPHLPLPFSLIPLPVRYHIRYGEPILLHEEYRPEEADYPEVLDRATERVKIAVQALIRDELRERRGLFR